MLIQTPYKSGDIISFKLTSGEEIVAKFEEETEKEFRVRNPLGMAMIGNGGYGLAPYMMTVDPKQSFTFRREAIVVINKTVDDTANSYIEATSGIQLGDA
jgi:hypothetical protein